MTWETFNNIRGPKGDVGPEGRKGDDAEIVSIGVSTLSPEAPAQAQVTGGSRAHIALGVPQGKKGDRGPAGALSSASAESVPASAQAAVILSGTDEVKHAQFKIPRGLPGAEALPTAEAVGDYLAAEDSPTQPGFDLGSAALVRKVSSELYSAVSDLVRSVADPDGVNSRISRLRFDVSDYGAVGDGATDDGPAVQAAVDALEAAGGGILYFPPGSYWFDRYVTLTSNMEIFGDDAEFYKDSRASHYAVFAILSNGRTGWGSGATNLYIHDLRFRGSFDIGNRRTLCGFALHHASDILFERLQFDECSGAGHALDLGGCERITIRDSVWRGFDSFYDLPTVEAIQIDVSNYTSMSVRDEPGSYDGLATRDVLVEGCSFLPLKKGARTFPAPNPLGSHTVVQGMYYERIAFRRNLVVSPTKADYTKQLPGSVHFVATRGIDVSHNTFEVTGTDPVQVFQTSPAGSGRRLEDVGDESPGVTIPTQVCDDVRFCDNILTGFDSNSSTVTAIRLAGSSLEGLNASGAEISRNQYRGNAGLSQMFAQITYTKQVVMQQNQVRNVRRLLYMIECDIVDISNNVCMGLHGAWAIQQERCSRVTIGQNNFADLPGPVLYLTNARSGQVITGNSFSALRSGITGFYLQADLPADRVTVSGNVVEARAGAQRGIYLEGNVNGVAFGNVAEGFTIGGVVAPTGVLTGLNKV